MKINILTEESYDELKCSLDSPLGMEIYLMQGSKKWEELNRRTVSLPTDLASEESLGDPRDFTLESMRGKLIYDSFRDISPIDASNKLLWSTLCHYHYKTFVAARWFKGLAEVPSEVDKLKKLQRVFISRYFYRPGMNGAQRNAIARYYWACKKTIGLWNSPDVGSTRRKSDDLYELTDFMMNDQQIWQDTMQRGFGASDYLRFIYLRSSQELKNHLLQKKGSHSINDEHFSKWLSKLFLCWINGRSYKHWSADETVDSFMQDALGILNK